ncbi:MAG: nickel-responsive transcriptional regulator NikR [Nitrososphaera sp.]
MQKKHTKHNGSRKRVDRISMSLPPKLLTEFDLAMKKAGYSDRSKAVQTAMHFFIDEYNWKEDDNHEGAGAIVLLYDHHTYNHDSTSTHTQHDYTDIISAVTHTHLDHNNCLETIMVKGEIARIKQLAKKISENRGIKSLKVNFVNLV